MFLFTLKIFKIALTTLLTTVIFLVLVRSFVIEPGRVNGRSMESTFTDNDVFFVNKYILLFHEPQRGDVVQAIDPLSGHIIIKRVIGLPGEQLSLRSGKVHLLKEDGSEILLQESWLSPSEWTSSPENTSEIYLPIPEYEYFLMGDNRNQSTDSRTYGPVHRNQIYGLVYKLPF
ncbi:MAG: signal peptidase I [bacterium]|jgi:signal peptidase I|nr:signal peptidase I [bacterium]